MLISELHGNLGGLKASQIKELERLYRRRTPSNQVITWDLAKALCHISHEIRRQVGLIIDRRGEVVYVIVGNDREIMIPDLSNYRLGQMRLRGCTSLEANLLLAASNGEMSGVKALLAQGAESMQEITSLGQQP